MRKVKLEYHDGIEIEIVQSTMRKIPGGCVGSATVRTADGRTVEMRGKWEDPYLMCDEPGYEETGATIDETVTIDGQIQPDKGENSVQIPYVRADGVEDGIEIEEIANAIAE